MSDKAVRSVEEIESAINTIEKNGELLYGYKHDVIAILSWVLNGEPFDGIDDDEYTPEHAQLRPDAGNFYNEILGNNESATGSPKD